MEMLLEPLVLTTVVAAVAMLLVYAKNRYPANSDEQIINAINDCLPQTQCAQCGHPGCLPYARAIAEGEPINRCPPGGADTIQTLAHLLGREPIPLDPEYGEESARTVAVIREAECIGCTLCIQACPVDAIIGAQQYMHSVLPDVCTGCDLCLPPCPVDCIDMVEVAVVQPPSPNLRPLVKGPESACIHCGDCEPVCPRNLSPQNLLWHRGSLDALSELNLNACIECRLCDRACPSAIPLTERFIESKRQLAAQQTEQAAAAQAESRFKLRAERLEKATVKVKTKPSSDDRAALLARLKK